MSVANLNELFARLRNPTQISRNAKNGQLATGTHWNSEWLSSGIPGAGAAPAGAASIPDRTTTGSMGQGNKAGSEQRAHVAMYRDGSGLISTMVALVDRLAHKGGLDGTVTTAQTVSTPALTRFTDGINVVAAVEIYTAVGATGTTISIDYTNEAGTAGRTSPGAVIGGSGFSNARLVLPLPLQVGDRGVKAVNTATLAATTATAGNFGITLFKILAILPFSTVFALANRGDPARLAAAMPVIPDDACLQLLHWGGGQANVTLQGEVMFFED